MVGKLTGRVWKVGDDVDTDLVIAGPYLTIRDEDELASHAFEALIPDFSSKVREGDAVVAGKNFGTGSSREEAVFVLKRLGVRAFFAESFARIFFRNSINLGVLALQKDGISAHFSTGDEYSFDPASSIIVNETTGLTLELTPLPEFLLEIYESGGALAKIKKDLA
ncbi:MAG: LeuD/DmdB family oxidoreductase small subunit [Promethearchaeota archaeon]